MTCANLLTFHAAAILNSFQERRYFHWLPAAAPLFYYPLSEQARKQPLHRCPLLALPPSPRWQRRAWPIHLQWLPPRSTPAWWQHTKMANHRPSTCTMNHSSLLASKCPTAKAATHLLVFISISTINRFSTPAVRRAASFSPIAPTAVHF